MAILIAMAIWESSCGDFFCLGGLLQASLWEKQKRLGLLGGWQGGGGLELGKALRPRWVGCSKSKKIKVCKEAPAPSRRRFALARIIVCCGASIVAHFACKVSDTNT